MVMALPPGQGSWYPLPAARLGQELGFISPMGVGQAGGQCGDWVSPSPSGPCSDRAQGWEGGAEPRFPPRPVWTSAALHNHTGSGSHGGQYSPTPACPTSSLCHVTCQAQVPGVMIATFPKSIRSSTEPFCVLPADGWALSPGVCVCVCTCAHPLLGAFLLTSCYGFCLDVPPKPVVTEAAESSVF